MNDRRFARTWPATSFRRMAQPGEVEELGQLRSDGQLHVIGRPNRVYEILSYRRSLTLPMIQRLHSKLGIPAESLIKPTPTAERRRTG